MRLIKITASAADQQNLFLHKQTDCTGLRTVLSLISSSSSLLLRIYSVLALTLKTLGNILKNSMNTLGPLRYCCSGK